MPIRATTLILSEERLPIWGFDSAALAGTIAMEYGVLALLRTGYHPHPCSQSSSLLHNRQ